MKKLLLVALMTLQGAVFASTDCQLNDLITDPSFLSVAGVAASVGALVFTPKITSVINCPQLYMFLSLKLRNGTMISLTPLIAAAAGLTVLAGVVALDTCGVTLRM